MRVGKKKQPTYRVVVADARCPRDGRFIETIGHYGPRQEPSVVEIDGDRALDWLRKGAQPTEQVQKLLTITGVWATFESEKGGSRRHEAQPARLRHRQGDHDEGQEEGAEPEAAAPAATPAAEAPAGRGTGCRGARDGRAPSRGGARGRGTRGRGTRGRGSRASRRGTRDGRAERRSDVDDESPTTTRTSTTSRTRSVPRATASSVRRAQAVVEHVATSARRRARRVDVELQERARRGLRCSCTPAPATWAASSAGAAG